MPRRPADSLITSGRLGEFWLFMLDISDGTVRLRKLGAGGRLHRFRRLRLQSGSRQTASQNRSNLLLADFVFHVGPHAGENTGSVSSRKRWERRETQRAMTGGERPPEGTRPQQEQKKLLANREADRTTAAITQTVILNGKTTGQSTWYGNLFLGWSTGQIGL